MMSLMVFCHGYPSPPPPVVPLAAGSLPGGPDRKPLDLPTLAKYRLLQNLIQRILVQAGARLAEDLVQQQQDEDNNNNQQGGGAMFAKENDIIAFQKRAGGRMILAGGDENRRSMEAVLSDYQFIDRLRNVMQEISSFKPPATTTFHNLDAALDDLLARIRQ